MKTALIHYWLVNDRGGEKVLGQLTEIFPEADVFAHVYEPSAMPDTIRSRNVRTTWIQKLPFANKNYQSYLPLMPRALRSLNLDEFDLIISSESGPAKGIRKPEGAVHICYCHTPMRYLWDMADEYYRQASPLKKLGMKLLLPWLRRQDLWSAGQVDHFIANSRFVAERIKRIYDRDSVVIHPPVNTDHFCSVRRNPADFYLFFGQLTAYKRADLAVLAFNRLGKRLVIAGTGEERSALEKLAGPNIEFLGRISDGKRDELYSSARALVFPGVEDFGIVPVEAQAAGCPVIALRAGGALETVIEGRTGVFFDRADTDELCDAVERLELAEFSEESCRENSRRFSEDRFRREIRGFVDGCLG